MIACRGAQQQQPQSSFQDIPTQSWYPPSVVNSSSRPSTSSSSSGIGTHQRASDHPQSPSQGQPSLAEAAGTISRLKDKRYFVVILILVDYIMPLSK